MIHVSTPSILKVISLADTSDQTVALEEMFSCLADELDQQVLEDLQEAVILREETSPTYLENSLAVPHGRIRSLNEVVVAVGINQAGIDWPVDEDKARIVIMVGVPAPMVTGYLKILQKIIRWHKSSKLIQHDGSVKPDQMVALERELKTALA